MRRGLVAMVVAGVVGLTASAANATLIVQTGVVGSFVDDNVIDNPCTGNVVGPALTIQGCLNTNHSKLVDLTSDENIQFDAGGQAKIVPSDGLFSQLQVSFADGTLFQTLILNVEATANGNITFFDNLGDVSGVFSISQNGNNFFSLSGDNFGFIKFVTDVGVTEVDISNDVKQIRIGAAGVTVPEPATLGLLGVGLAFLGLLRRWRVRA
jgi:hypothetical protein